MTGGPTESAVISPVVAVAPGATAPRPELALIEGTPLVEADLAERIARVLDAAPSPYENPASMAADLKRRAGVVETETGRAVLAEVDPKRSGQPPRFFLTTSGDDLGNDMAFIGDRESGLSADPKSAFYQEHLARFARYLQWMEEHLPVEAQSG